MLNWLQQILTPKLARRAQRGESVRLRRQFERLEDRAMLSATMGPMPPGHGGNSYAPQNLSGPLMADAGMFAAPPRHHAGQQAASLLSNQLPGGPAHGAMHNQPGMLNGPDYGPNLSHYDSGFASYNSGLSHQAAGVQFPTNPLPQTTYYIVIIVPNAPVFVEDYSHLPVAALTQSPPKSSPLLAPPIGAPKAAAARAPASASIESPRGVVSPALNSLPLMSAAFNIPTAAQIVSRDIDSAALLPTGALDAAFQSYASRLLLATTTSANDRAMLKALDNEATARDESLDEFIRLTDFTIADDKNIPSDAVERERAAVDAVLRGLQDVDTLPDEPITSATSDDETNVTDNTELGFAPIAEAEGGMVMLEASGDANDSDFNLAGVADDHLDLLNVRVGVEASVGFYQAVDVATEDVPTASNLPTASPVMESARDDERDDRVSKEGETGSSPKAAAAVGAMTLVGALLWASQRTRSDDDRRVKSADEKKSRRGMAS